MGTKVMSYLSHSPANEVEVTLKHGLRACLDPTDVIQRFVHYWGVWAPNESWIVERLLRPGDTFIDAGANFCYFTLLPSRIVAGAAQHVSFKPPPHPFRRIHHTLT